MYVYMEGGGGRREEGRESLIIHVSVQQPYINIYMHNIVSGTVNHLQLTYSTWRDSAAVKLSLKTACSNPLNYMKLTCLPTV